LAKDTSAQAPPATTSDTASDPNVSNNHSLNEVALDKLPGEIIITKMQSSKTNSDLSTPALVELNNRGVPASVVKAIMTPRTLRRDAGVTGP